MTDPRLRFYFDYESPNAFLAWIELPKVAERRGVALDLVPVLYAALLDAHGQLGPGEMPAKGRWMGKNVLRKAALLGVSLNLPEFFPFNPLLALRVSMVPLEESDRRAVVDALFRAVWVHGLHVSEAPVVTEVLDAVGLSGAALVAQAQTPEAKARLRRQTDDAIARGVFGVPAMEVGDELFWGYDDLPDLERFLAGNDSLDPEAWQRWSQPRRPSSVRKQFRSTQGPASSRDTR